MYTGDCFFLLLSNSLFILWSTVGHSFQFFGHYECLLCVFTYKPFIGVCLGEIPRSGIIGSYVKCIFNFKSNHQTVFPSGHISFSLPPWVCKSSSCFTSSPALDIDILFHFGHSSGCEMVSCHCDLHFTDDNRDLHIFSYIYHKYLLFKSYPHWRKGLVCLIALRKLLTDSRYKPFVRYMCCKSLLSVSMLSLLILIGILEVDIISTLLQRGRNWSAERLRKCPTSHSYSTAEWECWPTGVWLRTLTSGKFQGESLHTQRLISPWQPGYISARTGLFQFILAPFALQIPDHPGK